MSVGIELITSRKLQGPPDVLLIFLEKTIELLSSSATDAEDGQEPLQLQIAWTMEEGQEEGPLPLMLPYPKPLLHGAW